MEIWCLKDNGVTTSTFWGHTTSSVMWLFDSRQLTSYGDMTIWSSSRKALPGTEIDRWWVGQSSFSPQYYTDLIYSSSLRYKRSAQGIKNYNNIVSYMTLTRPKQYDQSQAEAKPRPVWGRGFKAETNPKFWPRSHFGLKDSTSTHYQPNCCTQCSITLIMRSTWLSLWQTKMYSWATHDNVVQQCDNQFDMHRNRHQHKQRYCHQCSQYQLYMHQMGMLKHHKTAFIKCSMNNDEYNIQYVIIFGGIK